MLALAATHLPHPHIPDQRTFSPRRCLALCLALALSLSASAQFTELALEAGLHTTDPDLVAQNTGGVWVVDINGDGWPDLYATRLQGGADLFINQQDGTFAIQAASLGLSGPEAAHGALFGDIDNDGDPDLVVGLLNDQRNYLYLNQGDGTFTEQASQNGIAQHTQDPLRRVYGGTWGDYDADGFLDLHLPEWFDTGTSIPAGTHSLLFRNLGQSSPGHFENVTTSAGVEMNDGDDRQHAFASAFADIDQDGWPDLLVTGDFGTSRFFRNLGNGSFEDATDSYRANKAQNAMGITVGDYDGDLQLDYFETSIYDNPGLPQPRGNTGNRLYRFRPELSQFTELSSTAGVRNSGFGWGTSFLDFDNDGDLDLIATNAVFANDGSLPEPTKLWRNDGQGTFTDVGESLGISDDGNGYGLATLDYDQDGDLDIVIGQKGGQLLLYRNDQNTAHSWLRLSLEGTLSNHDGIGTKILVTPGGDLPQQYFEYNPSNLFMAQAEAVQHIGLGPNVPLVEQIQLTWPSGAQQILSNVPTGQILQLIEPESDDLTAPSFTLQPSGGTFAKGDTLTLAVEFSGNPPPTVQWYRNGELIPGATQSTFEIESLHAHEAGTYQARIANTQGSLFSSPAVVAVVLGEQPYSIARWWNELLLDAIRKDFPAPTVHARNLYHVSAAMWDAYWAYEPDAWDNTQAAYHQETPALASLSEEARPSAQAEAISYAAFRILMHRYENSVGAERSLADFIWLMQQLGYDPSLESTEGDSPPAVGNRIAAAILSATADDGSNEKNGYADPDGYAAQNEPLYFKDPGTEMADPNRWQPLAFDKQITQNGIELKTSVQEYVGSHWGAVTPFSLDDPRFIPHIFDPGPPPLLGTESSPAFIANAVEVIRYSSFLDPADETTIDISPGARFNNTLGKNNGAGHALNPATGLPYAANVVKRADYGRVLAEFWADGPSSETPPGHWNALYNEISEHPDLQRRLAGSGPELSRLRWDVLSYLALNGAMHDAAIAAWGAKRQYDYSRPISMIRYLGGLGQSSDPLLPSYHEYGLPLIPDLIELITAESTASGQRHQHLADHVGEIAIRAWQGQPEDAEGQAGGVGWIRASEWIPYQRSTFVTPAFAAYVSGHSCFSRAGAEVLTLLTGSPYFPGGMGVFTFPAYDYLEFEAGPSETLVLQWATYYDAADQAGLSRLYGGIHVSADDFLGRQLGSKVGLAAFLKTRQLLENKSEPSPLTPVTITSPNAQSSDSLLANLIPHPTTAQFTAQPLTLSLTEASPISELSTFTTATAVEVRFTLQSELSSELLIRALSQSDLWPTTNQAGTLLRLYSIDSDNSETLVASNADGFAAERASLATSASQLYQSPHAPLAEGDAALFLQLESGSYLLRVEADSTLPAIQLKSLR